MSTELSQFGEISSINVSCACVVLICYYWWDGVWSGRFLCTMQCAMLSFGFLVSLALLVIVDHSSVQCSCEGFIVLLS